jgi:hypothetical protein
MWVSVIPQVMQCNVSENVMISVTMKEEVTATSLDIVHGGPNFLIFMYPVGS